MSDSSEDENVLNQYDSFDIAMVNPSLVKAKVKQDRHDIFRRDGFQPNDERREPHPRYKRKKAIRKDGFEHLNKYEDIITAAFKKSLESGNRYALKYVQE